MIPVDEIKERAKKDLKKGYWKLERPITPEEVSLASKDLPGNKAPGPDKYPSEIYKNCTAIGGTLAELFTKMAEWDCVPAPARRFYIVPLDKAGKDPRKCADKRPIALLSPMMKLLELILARRLLPKLEGKLAEEQYAYQKARSTELLLEDLD